MSNSTVAQVVPDSTLESERSQVRTGVRIQGRASQRIEGGARRGGTLFHSFQDFSVGEGQQVFFANPEGIKNIVSRVTGTNSSIILGTLGVLGQANLFLLNPNGIVFGANAQLDIRGSFTASASSRFTFPDGSEFSATRPQVPPLLTVQVPIGLQLGERTGDIVNAATIFPASGQSITLQGRNIIQTGALATTGGAIQLFATDDLRLRGYAASVSTVGGDVVLQAGRDIILDNQAAVNTGILPTLEIGDAGNITIQAARNLTLMNGARLFSTVDQEVVGNAGMINLRAGRALLITSSDASSTTQGIGNAAPINLTGQTIAIQNSSRISSATSSLGDAASISFASNQLVIDHSVVSTGVNVGGNGRGGPITIRTPLAATSRHSQVLIRDNASLSAATVDVGDAGRLQVKTRQFTIDNAEVSTATYASGDAGRLNIDADSVLVRNGGRINSSTSNRGNGGVITIHTQDLNVETGGQIVSASGETAAGNAGQLNILAKDAVTVSNRANGTQSLISTQSNGTGNAGGLLITTEQLQVNRGADISVSGVRNPGNLIVNANAVRLDRGILEAITQSGAGANIQLTANDYLFMNNRSAITAKANNNGNGGNLSLNADFVIASSNTDSDIVANAFKGAGGQITITTQSILGLSQRTATPNNGTNDIDASSQFGAPGSVTINQPIDLSRGLADLPTIPVDVTNQIAQTCPTNTEEADRLGSFIISGRGGLPSSPTDLLSDDNTLTEWVTPSEASNTQAEVPFPASAQPLVEAQGWVKNANGEIQLVAATPSALPFTPGQCR